MTTGQIIILSIAGILAVAGFIGNGVSKTEEVRFLWSTLLFFSTAIFALVAITTAAERESLLKKVKGKCPEYEKIEVYKLKETK